MKGLVHNLICEGQFNGGEIEPGTFHVHNTQSNNSGLVNVASNDDDMPDYDGKDNDQASDLDPENVSNL